MSLKAKIFIHFLFLTILATILMHVYIWSYLENKFLSTYFEKLTISREIKKDQVQTYFKTLKNDIVLLSQNPYVINLAKSSVSNKDKHQLEKKYLDIYKTEKNYSNIFITSVKEKKLVYTSKIYMKESCSFFGNICNEYENSKSKDIKFLDFKYYEAFDKRPASFMSKPIYENNELLGVVIIQISIDTINAIMTEKEQWSESGYEKTGETYIIGQDCKMRNDSRFLIEDKENYLTQAKNNGLDTATIQKIKQNKTTVLLQSIKQEVCTKLNLNSSNVEIIKDYRGIEVLSSQTMFNIYNVTWMILAEIDKDEVFEPIYDIKTKISSILFILFIFFLVSTYIFSHQIAKQLELLKNGFISLARGDLNKQVKILSHDEFGDLSRSFNEALARLARLKKSVKYYSKLSEVDTLTQIFNRRKIDEILDAYLEKKENSISIIMFDIDFFKKINDKYGHDAGDYALVELSKIISKNIRTEDILARWGGEEFVIVVMDLDIDKTYELAYKLKLLVNRHKFDTFKKMSCSFGVATLRDSDTKETLLKRVDDAMYKAKESGRDQVSIMR